MSSTFLPLKMSVAVKLHFACPCLPVLDVDTSMICASITVGRSRCGRERAIGCPCTVQGGRPALADASPLSPPLESHLAGAALDHHEGTLADAARRHRAARVGRVGGGIGCQPAAIAKPVFGCFFQYPRWSMQNASTQHPARPQARLAARRGLPHSVGTWLPPNCSRIYAALTKSATRRSRHCQSPPAIREWQKGIHRSAALSWLHRSTNRRRCTKFAAAPSPCTHVVVHVLVTHLVPLRPRGPSRMGWDAGAGVVCVCFPWAAH